MDNTIFAMYREVCLRLDEMVDGIFFLFSSNFIVQNGLNETITCYADFQHPFIFD